MTEKLERPKFLSSFFAALSEKADDKKIWRMFVAPVFTASIGGTVAYYILADFWSDHNWGIATAVYTGILTLNGLILALSWSAFSRIYESISAPKFCSFLRRNKLLNKYIVTVSFIHGLQLFSIIATATGLVVLLINVEHLIIDRVLFGVMVFSSIYAIQRAASAVSIMNDLLWQKSIFDEHQESKDPDKVVSLGGRSE